MEFKGKIIWADEPRGGTSAKTGEAWASQDFVIEREYETARGLEKQSLKFNVYGKELLDKANLQVGDECTITWSINARNYAEGKWINEVRASKIEKLGSQPF